MKRLISIMILTTMLLQITLPGISFAIDEIEENEKSDTKTMQENKEKIENDNSEEENKNDKQEIITEKNEQEQEQEEIKQGEIKQEDANKNDQIINEIEQEESKKTIIEKEDLQELEKITVKALNNDNNIVFDERIQQALFENGYDQNNDGNFTEEELQNNYNNYLWIDCNGREVDLTNMEYLVNIRHLCIENYRGCIDCSKLNKMPKLEQLRLSGYIDDIDSIESISNLKQLDIDHFYEENMSRIIEKLANLEQLERLGLCAHSKTINYEPLSNLKNLKELSLRYISIRNLKGIENLTKLESLNLALGYDPECDIDTVLKLGQLTTLTIENFYNNIGWVQSLTNVKRLYIHNNIYEEPFVVTNEFVNTINSLQLEDFNMTGRVSIDLGEVKAENQLEIPFENIPILKAVTDETSRFYNNGEIRLINLENGADSQLPNIDNINIDTQNKIIYITPKEENRRRESIELSENLTADLIWSLESDNEEIVFSEAIKQELLREGADENGDGKITPLELEKRMEKSTNQNGEIQYNSLNYFNLNFDDNDEIDLTGIEKIQSIDTLNINNIRSNIDFSILNQLRNLKSLYLSGPQFDFTTLQGVVRT